MIAEDFLTKMWAHARAQNTRQAWARVLDRLEGALWLFCDQSDEDRDMLFVLLLTALTLMLETTQ